MSEKQNTSLDIEADQALFEGQIQGLAVAIYENERPPCGLAGRIDWHFQGAISHCIRRGAITGKVGECTYFPLTKNGVTFHIILAGAGHSPSPGQRVPLPAHALQNLQKNLVALKFPKVGMSQTDFGNLNPDSLSKQFKGVPLWIAP